ncbi:MAG: hypothetical protein PHE89_00825 [Alphaproteobacteria bacterium]|nr:hypothetical protein [Alphaproteobacteria bacterium]
MKHCNKHQHTSESQAEDKCEKIVFGSAFFAIFIHIFCCGIPACLAILSAFGIYVQMPFLEHDHNGMAEIIMFVVSGLFLLFSFYIYFKHNHCTCNHAHGSHDKWSRRILAIATGLYLFGIYTHFIAGHL